MEFAVIDRRTLQCVMSAEEIEAYGMDRKKLFKNDEKVREFFSHIMKKTEEETGYYKSEGDVAVQASFLPDESVEITFCVAKENSFCRKGKEESPVSVQTVIFKCKSLPNLMEFCRQMAISPQARLLRYRSFYYLLADLEAYEPYDVAVLFNLADEYVDEICYTRSIVACLLEHGTYMIGQDAIERLRSL